MRAASKQRLNRRGSRPHTGRPGVAAGAYLAGRAYGTAHRGESPEALRRQLQQYWGQWFLASRSRSFVWSLYQRTADRFMHGFYTGAGARPRRQLLLPTDREVTAIVTVKNEESTIAGVLGQLAKLPLKEIIVVQNGSSDGSFQRISGHPSRPVLVHYDQALGHDVGRAIGARLAEADILLVLDGDMVIPAHRLLPFVHAIARGTDVALNNMTPYLRPFHERDAVTVAKEFLNLSLGRPDLKANSLTAVPHALSRKAVETIGCEHLMVPPLAQTIAALSGLVLKAPASVNVIKRNKRRALNTGSGNPVSRLILGDHIEAFHYAMARRGDRLAFADTLRERGQLGGCPDDADQHHHSDL